MTGFIIMLDDYMDVFPDHWPISGAGDEVAVLRQQRQHDGNPETVPRTAFRTSFVESKALIHTPSGRVDRGGIYEVLR